MSTEHGISETVFYIAVQFAVEHLSEPKQRIIETGDISDPDLNLSAFAEFYEIIQAIENAGGDGACTPTDHGFKNWFGWYD